MKQTKKRFIDLYYEWMEAEALPESGICHSLPKSLVGLFEMFMPTVIELSDLREQRLPIIFWGYGEPVKNTNTFTRGHIFTPLRQNIILLCAAMEGEL